MAFTNKMIVFYAIREHMSLEAYIATRGLAKCQHCGQWGNIQDEMRELLEVDGEVRYQCRIHVNTAPRWWTKSVSGAGQEINS